MPNDDEEGTWRKGVGSKQKLAGFSGVLDGGSDDFYGRHMGQDRWVILEHWEKEEIRS